MSKNKAILGVILILLGVLFLLRGLDLFYFSFGSLIRFILPFALIAIGINMIVRRRQRDLALDADTREHVSSSFAQAQSSQVNTAEPAKYANAAVGQASSESPGSSESARLSNSPDGVEDEWVKYNKFIGEMYIDFAGLSVEKIDVSGFIGDVEIKMIDGKLAKGLNRLFVSGFIGDVRIFLPRDIAYSTQCSNFIGDIEVGAKRSSGISNRIDTQSQNYEEAESKLFICANSFIGDIRIYLL